MISDQHLLSSPVVQRYLANMNHSGLHKTAGAASLGVNEVTLDAAVQALGTKLAYAHLRRVRVQSGLDSLAVLNGTFDKHANLLKALRGTQGQAAAAAAAPSSHLVPMGSEVLRLEGANAAEAAARAPVSVQLPEWLRNQTLHELPTNMPRPTPAAASTGMRTKARPTQAFDPESLRINSLFEGTAAGQGGQALDPSMFGNVTSAVRRSKSAAAISMVQQLDRAWGRA